MKSPDEIKTALKHCSSTKNNVCSCCPYDCHNDGAYICVDKLLRDALAYIQQLEAELDDEKNKNEILIFDNDKLMEEIAQAERERDACIYDLDKALSWDEAADCHFCKRRSEPACYECDWQWRGVCPENSKEG